MTKELKFFKKTASILALSLLVVISSLVGAFLIRQAYSFQDPTTTPTTPGNQSSAAADQADLNAVQSDLNLIKNKAGTTGYDRTTDSLEALGEQLGGATTARGSVMAMSAKSASNFSHANAAKYCYDLSGVAQVAIDGDTLTTYTDWRLPTTEEIAMFISTITDTDLVWTATVDGATAGSWIKIKLSDGFWAGSAYGGPVAYARCVR